MLELTQRFNLLEEHYKELLYDTYWVLGIITLFLFVVVLVLIFKFDQSILLLYLWAILGVSTVLGPETFFKIKEGKERHLVAEEILPHALDEKHVSKFPLNFDDSEVKTCPFKNSVDCATVKFKDSGGIVYEVHMSNDDYFKLDQNKTYSVDYPAISNVDLKFLDKYGLGKFYLDAVKIEEIKPTKGK